MPRTSGLRVWVGIAVAAVAVVASACSSSKSGGSTNSTASGGGPSATGSAATGSTIKIGYALSLSGPEASSTLPSLNAAQAWVSYTNDNGGLNGHKLELTTEDTAGDASVAQAAVKKLVETDNVPVMLLSDPITEGAVGDYLAGKNIPVIGASGYNPDVWNKHPNFFALTPPGAQVIASMVPAGHAAGLKKVAAAVCSESSTCLGNAQIIQPMAEKVGTPAYVGLVKVSSAATDYTAECLSFKSKGADYVDLTIAPQGAAHLMQNCIQQGYNPVFGTAATSFDQSLYSKITGMKMIGTLNGFPWWSDAPAVKTFRDAMDKYQSGKNFSTTAATTVWTALELLKKALAGATGDITRQSIIGAYDNVKNETLDGLLAQPVTFTAGKPAPQVNCFWQYTYNAGDKNPTLLPPSGTSGNGTSGDLASACLAS